MVLVTFSEFIGGFLLLEQYTNNKSNESLRIIIGYKYDEDKALQIGYFISSNKKHKRLHRALRILFKM
jgi:hypothetical protein